jgi:hypothetical protein
MKGQDYRKLIEDTARANGTDPAEALEEFIALVRQIDNHREHGAVCQEQKQELSAHYDYHLKGIPLPEGVEPIPMPQLSRKYGFWKNAQKRANQSVAILTVRANKLLGGDFLKTTNRSRPKGGGEDA